VIGLATMIAAHTRVGGDVSTDGDLVVEGRVDGSVRAGGQLTLGPAAVVTGAIEARDVRIAGRLDRGLRAEGVVHLLGTAEVHGDLEAARVVIDDGAVFEGQVRLVRPAQMTPRPQAQRTVSRTGTRTIPELATPGRRRAHRRPA